MGGRRRTGVLATVLVAVLLAPGAAGAQEVPVIPSTDLLPPIVPDEPAPDQSAVCGDDGLVCVRYVEEELAGWEAFFGCDHRAVFPTVYRLLTRETRLVLEADPSVFQDPAGLGFEALAFYELYEEMITAHLAGEPIPQAWQLAMDAAQRGDWTGGHDMLLAISAHVNRDMPFAVARAGLVLPDGRTRKVDHDQFNRVLASSYDTIVRAIGERYDPMMTTVADLPTVDDVGAQQLVAGWREGVWRNAEQLVATADGPLADVSSATIEAWGVTWATALLVGEIPGRRALRDAHCAAWMAAQAEAPVDHAAPTPAPTPAPAPAGPTEAAGPNPAVDAAAGALPATGGGASALALALAVVASRVARRP